MLDYNIAIYSTVIFFIYVYVYGTKNESNILINDWHTLLSIVVTTYFKNKRS
jgi:hypothetical protein